MRSVFIDGDGLSSLWESTEENPIKGDRCFDFQARVFFVAQSDINISTPGCTCKKMVKVMDLDIPAQVAA